VVCQLDNTRGGARPDILWCGLSHFGEPGAVRLHRFKKTNSIAPLNLAPQFTNSSGKFRGKVAISKPSWQFGGITVSEKGFQGGHSMMQKAKSVPAGEPNMPKRSDNLNRFTDHLVALLRDVQTTLADHQPEREPEKRTGS